jgi:hypothetical protein
MPVIGAIGRGNLRLPGESRTDDARSNPNRPSSGALVPVRPAAANDGLRESSHRPAPAFLAHLAATRQRAPQTRAGRRVDPLEAAAAYGAMLVPETITGRVFRRWV